MSTTHVETQTTTDENKNSQLLGNGNKNNQNTITPTEKENKESEETNREDHFVNSDEKDSSVNQETQPTDQNEIS